MHVIRDSLYNRIRDITLYKAIKEPREGDLVHYTSGITTLYLQLTALHARDDEMTSWYQTPTCCTLFNIK